MSEGGRKEPNAEDRHYHARLDPHVEEPRLYEVILGGQDGLVNTLGVILGVAAASGEARLVVAAGLAATFAESVSMGAVAYTSERAHEAYYESERRRELRHIERVPELEREEVRQIFARKGFEGELLEKIVEKICADREVWVALMLAEEHKIVAATKGEALRSAVVVFFAALIGSLVPLAPFFVMPLAVAVPVALLVSALTLFGVGYYKAKSYVGSPMRSGLEMALIGMASALIGYGIGYLFNVTAA